MTKRLIPLGGAALAALGVLAVAFAGNGSSNTSAVRTATQPAAEISGPCDEAEHANDPRCAVVAGAVTKTKAAANAKRPEKAERRREAREDRSGPSGRRNDDQAEARGRAAENEVEVENRGREAENEVEVENEVENEPAEIEDDHSGPGGDDQNDDHSGPGDGSGEEDRSGSNSGSG